jgi:hypothetical protein
MSVYSQFEPDDLDADDCPCAEVGEYDPSCTKAECRERGYRLHDQSIWEAVERSLEFERLMELTENPQVKDDLAFKAMTSMGIARTFLTIQGRV